MAHDHDARALRRDHHWDWLPYTALRDAIFAHLMLAEGLNTVFWAIT